MAATDDIEQLPSMQELQSTEQMELLDVVDSLRACGLSQIVALPQLIVCGDQSSGKSSVLEAISGVPFPRQDTLCTRFATEVILRRAPKVGIDVSIVLGEDEDRIDEGRLSDFRHGLKTKEDIKDAFERATEVMGLASAGKSFSNHILRIEVCGPSQPQLTLVDLPGLIHTTVSTQAAGDVQLVHNLVTRYLKNPRSIILAVVSANYDISNQIILQNVREVDPHGQRTLGIITKPDLLARGSKSEDAFVNLARNEDVKFSLGWHVVKNLDSARSQNQQEGVRDQQESLFFQMSGFSRLPAHTLGIAFLRTRLSRVLFNQVRQELPRLVEDIETLITTMRIARDKLGPNRSEPEQQQDFLISLSETFQIICRDAVKGDYDHEFFQDDANTEKRLCAKVMNMHFDFASNIRKNGATWLVGNEGASSEKRRTRIEAIKDACMLLKKSRGRELPGLPNPLLVGELFRQYSRPWGDLARLHIKEVWDVASRFLELLLRHLTDEDVCENVLAFWLLPIMEEKLKLAYAKHDELLEVHKDHPMTTNTQFIERSRAPRKDRSNKELRNKLWNRFNKDLAAKEYITYVDIDEVLNSGPPADLDTAAAEEAFDNMNAYYEIALNLFTDNVPTLAIQAPIIREVPKIFCPTTVRSMDPMLVRRIAGETEEKMTERDSILRRLATLEKGAVICKQYAKRPQRVLNGPAGGFDLPNPSFPESKTPADKGKNAAVDTLSIQRSLPAPSPSTASTPGPSSQLLVPSTTENESRTGSPAPFVLQQSRTPSPSPKPGTKTPTPQPVNSKTANAGAGGGLLGSNLGPSTPSGFGRQSPTPSNGENADKKTPSEALFGATPSHASGTGLPAAAAKPPAFKGFGAPSNNTTTGFIFKDTHLATPLFSFPPTSTTGFGNTSTAPAGSTSTGAFGGSGVGMVTAKNDNSLNKLPTKS